MQELLDFVSGLHQLIPETDHMRQYSTSRFMAKEEAAAEKLDDLHAQGNLDKIWFCSLDDRRDTVPAAHHETFHWTLERSK